MVKRVKKVTKGKITRERKKVIIVGTEGNNKTEEIYLRNLERVQNQYHFIFSPQNDTDPVNIVKNTILKSRQEDISRKQGDFAVSIFDLDVDDTKQKQFKEAKELADSKNVDIITSNPCFELWFLEHFLYTSKPFYDSSELIRELKKYIPEYTKYANVFELLYPKINSAIKNCEKLDEHHNKSNSSGVSAFSNPRTDMYKLVGKLLSGA